jgi:LysM repeat protein
MNRIVTTITALTASLFLNPAIGADESLLEQINSRLMAIESRLSALEGVNQPSNSSYDYYSSYQEAGKVESTNENTVSKIPAPPIPEASPAPAAGESTAPRKGLSSTYVIKEGDTLGSIARFHEVERSELLNANRLSEGQPIYIGETLLIPGGEPLDAEGSSSTLTAEVEIATPTPADEKSIGAGEVVMASGGTTHAVVVGDTLTSLARQSGTTVKAIKEANGLSDDVIELGQILTMPAAESAPVGMVPSAAEENTETASNNTVGAEDVTYEYDNPLLSEEETYGYYTVNKGDNLYALARDFFTTMGELQRLNRLGDSTIIYPGNELIVPTTKYNEYHNSGDVAQR